MSGSTDPSTHDGPTHGGPGGDPDRVPSDGDRASSAPHGTPTGNPLDPVARPGVDVTDAPRTGRTAPPHDEVAPHDAVVTEQEQSAAREEQADPPVGGVTGPDAPAQDAADPDGRDVPPPHPGAESADPDPGDTAGLGSGGGVEPGDTPPASGGTETSLARDEKIPGGRTRLLVPIGIVVVLAILVAAFFVGQFL